MIAKIVSASAAPPEEIRRKIQETLARDDYNLEPSDGRQESLLALIWRLFHWLTRPFVALFDWLYSISPPLAWLMVAALVGLLVVLIAHIGYTLVRAFSHRQEATPWTRGERNEREVDPAAVEREAAQLAARQDYVGAVRLLFRASVLRIERVEQRKFRAGVTNREILRRYRQQPWGAALRTVVDTLDFKWYGDEPCLPEDFDACRQACAAIAQGCGGLRHA